jgi:hypothetical protein
MDVKTVKDMMNKFSFAQMTSNSDGKTSGSGTSGIYLVFVGGLIGLIGSIAGLFMNSPSAPTVLLFATGTIATGAGLLGYRKSKDSKIIPIDPSIESNEDENKAA